MTIFAPLTGMLWRTLEAYGIDPRRVIKEDIYQPDGAFRMGERIPYSIYNQLLEKTASLINDPTVGLKSAEYLHPSHLGALGHAWLASSTLKTAIERAQRFSRMFDERLDMQVSEEPGILKVNYATDSSSPLPEIAMDSNLASLLTLCRLNFGKDLLPVYVRMCRASPPDPMPWHDFFGVEVEFDQSENSLAIKNQDATKQLTGSSPMLVALHEDVIRRQIAELDRSDIINRTLVVIMDQLPSGGVSEVSVAEALNMTTRTLHRRLAEKGISFRSLLTNVRKELVKRYIDEPAYSFTEISFLLGYTDTSAFSRAFKRWHGISPTEARRS
jgi:AraC-like DNA-binding protein